MPRPAIVVGRASVERSATIRATLWGMALAMEEGASRRHHALFFSRKHLVFREPQAAFLKAEGMKLPKAQKPRGRKPKAE